ncbi:MAG: polysaccharide deacetylase family protein, partial [Acetobacteraceae bacterium]
RCIGLRPGRLVILYYHGVSEQHLGKFRRQLDRLHASTAQVVKADFSGATEPGQWFVAITFDDALESVFRNAVPELAKRNMPTTIFVPYGVLGRTPDWEMDQDFPYRNEMVVATEQLHEVDPKNVTIGAHGMTHRSLVTMDRDAARFEITESKTQLSRILGREVDTFAFPYGDHDDVVAGFCDAAGYRFAFTSVPTSLDPAGRSLLRGRVSAEPTDWRIEFWLKIRGAYSWRRFMRAIRQLRAPRAHIA